jgi:hypothetical protein
VSGVIVSWELQDVLNGIAEDRTAGGNFPQGHPDAFLTADELDILAAKLLSGRAQARAVRNQREDQAQAMPNGTHQECAALLQAMDEADALTRLESDLHDLIAL